MLQLLRSALAALTLSLAPIPAMAQDADPALWVVKDADTTIYLFGTMHAMKPGLGWFDEAVKTAFDASGEVVLEVVEPAPAEMLALVMRLAVSTDGKPLTGKLSEARRADLARMLAGYGMPADALDRFDPWFAAVMLAGLPLPKLGYDPAQGAEHVLTDAARTDGKQLVGLETPEEQLGLFKSAPEAAQIAYLGTLMDEADRTGPILARIGAYWSAGEADALGDLMNEEMARTPALAKRLIADRNARWTDWIVERMKAPGTVFFAVGGGHMGGKGSVRELLARRRVKVVRVAY
jgi:uncharacterized protein YbaP (TraB family)